MNQIITIPFIKEFNPCESGLNNVIENYPELNCSLSELLQLEKIPYNDKIWLVTKIVDYKILQQWSVECAENVLHNYNKIYPNDNRVTECINVTKKYLNGECSLSELKFARSAARSAAWSATGSAARSAWSAAWSAAESARSAAESAAWSAAESAAWSAAESARSAARSARSEQENINLSILIALIENV